MREARVYQRVAYRMPVDLYCGTEQKHRHCQTVDIGLGGLFAAGVLCVRPEDPVRIMLSRPDLGALQLDSRVARVTMAGAGLEFIKGAAAEFERLREFLTPNWDGENLLEGVVRIAPWYQSSGLAGWMRLTTLVSDWQNLTLSARYGGNTSGMSTNPDPVRH